ncbi:SRPBCC domain-containing protein [Streptomyces sp. NPDC002817]|uniref:SRPBCC domain-containing protein n=1 Tax=Streptomyces sp. NPDC088357 TaxID=3154655 RepID=UPI00343E6910
MEHEVFVPVPAERLREALADPVRFARAVPGLQQDVGAEPVTGRLKVRVGSHTITYRGSARLSAQDDGSYAVEGDATEARGTGVVKLALTLRVDEADGGSRLTFDGTASADGRIKELPPEAVTSAVARLLNRFAEHLGASAQPKRGTQTTRATDTAGPPATEAPEPPTAKGTASPAVESTERDEPPAAERGEPSAAESTERDEPPAAAEGADVPDPAEASPAATPDAGTTEPAAPLAPEATEDLEPSATGDAEAVPDADDTAVPTDEPTAPEAPHAPDAPDEPTPGLVEPEPATPAGFTPDLPAEAAHARRTMIGRSAEEVDHAPPRGRYAPVPAPQTGAPHSTLRWAAPAAALVVASAIVVGRALRKRH